MTELITDEVVEFCIDLLCRRMHKCIIKQVLADKFQIYNYRTVERALFRARQAMRQSSLQSVEERVAEALAFYESVIRMDFATSREKILAQERIDKLLGLEHLRDETVARRAIREKKPLVDEIPDEAAGEAADS